jgi:dihydrofolate reductase
MREIVLSVGISLDGYIARPNGAFDFLFMPKDFSMAPFFATIDTAIMGRKTYDVARQTRRGSLGESRMANYVFSRTLPPGKRDGVIFTDQSASSLAKEFRKKLGANIWLMGGGELAQEFLKADLIDQLYLGVLPVLLGEGIPIFPSGFPQRDFSLIENKTYSQGVISLTYKRTRRKPKKKS